MLKLCCWIVLGINNSRHLNFLSHHDLDYRFRSIVEHSFKDVGSLFSKPSDLYFFSPDSLSINNSNVSVQKLMERSSFPLFLRITHSVEGGTHSFKRRSIPTLPKSYDQPREDFIKNIGTSTDPLGSKDGSRVILTFSLLSLPILRKNNPKMKFSKNNLGSQSGVTYQLYLNGVSPVLSGQLSGTGSVLTFANAVPYMSNGTYTVVATNNTSGCSDNMNGSVTVFSNSAPTKDLITISPVNPSANLQSGNSAIHGFSYGQHSPIFISMG